jgi:cobalt-zinc-cadmium efflux system outer membrane protein
MKALILMVIVSALLLGCSSGRSDETAWIPPQFSSEPWSVASSSTTRATGLPVTRPSLAGITLDQALRHSRGHPDLIAARARAEAATGRIQQAGLLPNPELVGRIESAPIDGNTTGDAEYVAGMSQGIPLGKRLSAAKRVEQLNRERLVREAEVREIEIARGVRGAFATALFAQEVVETQNDLVKAAADAVALAKARVDAGDAVREELARAEMEHARVRLEVAKSQSIRQQALLALTAATGDPSLAIDSIDGDVSAALEIPTLEELSHRLAESPFPAALAADVAAERAKLDLTKAERVPDVNLDLLYRRLGETDENAFDAGFRIAIPLFDRGRGRLREARADALAAEARATSAAYALQVQLRNAHARLTQALATAKTLREEVLPRADQILAGVQARYKGGDTSLSDVLLVQRDCATQKLAYLEALRDVLAAWAELVPRVRQ